MEETAIGVRFYRRMSLWQGDRPVNVLIPIPPAMTPAGKLEGESPMRMFSMLSAVLIAALMVGCASTQNSGASAGAVSECSGGKCCAAGECAKATAPGAVSEECCASTCTKAAEAAPGAVSEGCASQCTKSQAAPGAVSEGCASQCTKSQAAPGAVSEDCASQCTKSQAAPGAVSEKSGCCGNKTDK